MEDAAGADRLVADGFVVVAVAVVVVAVVVIAVVVIAVVVIAVVVIAVAVVVGWGRAETTFPSDMERAMMRMEVTRTILRGVVGVV